MYRLGPALSVSLSHTHAILYFFCSGPPSNFSPCTSGMLLATSIMTPKQGQPIRAVACYCHGYTDHASFSARMHYQKLVEQGIVVVSIEYEGHGRSDGAFGLINDWDKMTNDVAQYFAQVVKSDRFCQYPAFLVGESMGGAVAYCVYEQLPTLFRGVVLVCPMCKISDDMLPPQFVIDILRWLIGPTGTTSLLGFLPIAPSNNDLADVIHRVPEKGILNHQPPLNFGRHPRLATARELINVTQRISNSIPSFTAPFLVLHGLADRVTDPKLSQVLYDESSSTDKTIRLYEDMWHGLTCGEPDECADQVFADMTNWILARS
jgi:alpha-beta hydrolase superfamily lysophospholipase